MGGMNIRNNIARIGATALIGCGLVATSVPATFAVEGAPQVVYTYADSAQFFAPDVWVEGQGSEHLEARASRPLTVPPVPFWR